ncbi:peptidoglycan DD-metalloendopeptidase family protein [Streptomyces sp. NPDC058953]|uniref:peptidoglycan DD-metalloendopeptidase family protein n=1 Tax=unclassified Streptomyces TaxID=2593676 RepID=UPI0036C130AA
MCQRRRSPLLAVVVIWSVLLTPAPAVAGATDARAGTGTGTGAAGGVVAVVSAPDGGSGEEGASPAGTDPGSSEAAPDGGPPSEPDPEAEPGAEGGTAPDAGRTDHSAPTSGAPGGPVHGPVTGTSAEVARLFDETAGVTAAYERSLRETGVLQSAALGLQQRLGHRRTELAALLDQVGAVARDQYRTGGQLTVTAGLLLARDPDDLMRGRRVARQAETAVERLLAQARAAERRLSDAEDRARRAWHELERRTARLARSKKSLESRLEAARWILQGEAQSRAAAGTCPSPARLTAGSPGAGADGTGSTATDKTGTGTGTRTGTRTDGTGINNGTLGGTPGGDASPSWVAPVDRYLLSAGFGSGGARWAHRHTGQDFAVGIGAPVRSVGAGRVLTVSCGGAFGIQIVVQHPGGYYTQYAHLSSVGVVRGEPVRAGQVIGLAGSTGNSTGPHLHFEVRLTPYLGSGVDPAEWLRARGVPLISSAAAGTG